jgi:excisionase family DNA binding protein
VVAELLWVGNGGVWGMSGDSVFVGMQEAAELLGVSRQTVWRMVREGRLVKVPVKRGMMALRRVDVLRVGEGANAQMTEFARVLDGKPALAAEVGA